MAGEGSFFDRVQDRPYTAPRDNGPVNYGAYEKLTGQEDLFSFGRADLQGQGAAHSIARGVDNVINFDYESAFKKLTSPVAAASQGFLRNSQLESMQLAANEGNPYLSGINSGGYQQPVEQYVAPNLIQPAPLPLQGAIDVNQANQMFNTPVADLTGSNQNPVYSLRDLGSVNDPHTNNLLLSSYGDTTAETDRLKVQNLGKREGEGPSGPGFMDQGGTFDIAAGGLKALTGLYSAYLGKQQLDLSKDMFKENRSRDKANFANAAQSYNDAAFDRAASRRGAGSHSDEAFRDDFFAKRGIKDTY